MRHSKSDIRLVYVQRQRESILNIPDKMCDAIVDGLREHAEITKEEVVSEKTAQTNKKFVHRYGVDSSKQLAQIDYSLPEEAEKLDAHHHSIDHRNL